MIRLNNKEIGSVEIGRKAVSKIMQGHTSYLGNGKELLWLWYLEKRK